MNHFGRLQSQPNRIPLLSLCHDFEIWIELLLTGSIPRPAVYAGCFHNFYTTQIRKVIQLYETMLVRHGLMCVGPTGGGKTAIYEILKDALTTLHKDGHKHYFYRPVHTYVLNPKVRHIIMYESRNQWTPYSDIDALALIPDTILGFHGILAMFFLTQFMSKSFHSPVTHLNNYALIIIYAYDYLIIWLVSEHFM